MNRRVLLYAVMALSVCVSCDDDETLPVEPQPSVCLKDTPVTALYCMSKALAAQTSNYFLTLASDFVFSPTLDDSLDATFAGTGVFDNWDKQAEWNTAKLLFTDSNKSVLDIGSPVALINRTDFVRFELGYLLDVVYTTMPPDTVVYRGVAQVDVSNKQGTWHVSAWRETEQVPGYSTWGYLRGVLRQRLLSSP